MKGERGTPLSALGEFGLITRITASLGEGSEEVVVGPGDDACIITLGPAQLWAVTNDSLVEGVHFRRDLASPQDLGWKLAAINMSDTAAMGARPRYALVSLGLPHDVTAEYVDDLYKGMLLLCNEHGVHICGGDTVASPQGLCLSMTLLGDMEGRQPVRRGGAHAGDVLMVTGTLGASAAGLELLKARLVPSQWQHLADAHLRPRPRVQEGVWLAEMGVHAMIDVSDGLSGDLGHLTALSGLGAVVEVEKIPLPPGLADAAKHLGMDVLEWALHGGEDYELLFAADPSRVPEISRVIYEECGTTITHIGNMQSQPLLIARSREGSAPLPRRAYEHFV